MPTRPPKPSASTPHSATLAAPGARIKSIVRNTLLASPDFPRLYADVVISSAPNSNEAKILAKHYKKICGLTGADLTNPNPTTTTEPNLDRTNMPSVKECTHIKVTGARCGSPALRGEQFCYFHQRMIRTVKGPDSRLHHVALLENDEAIQASLMEVVNALIRGTIDLKRGELILRALNTAVRNIRRARFDNVSHMVTQIPDYSDPEPARGGADAPVRPCDPEVPGRSAVAPQPAATPAHVPPDAFVRPPVPEQSTRSTPSTKTPAAVDPTERKPPVSDRSAQVLSTPLRASRQSRKQRAPSG